MSGHETSHYTTQIDYKIGDHASASLGTISRKVASLGHGIEHLNHKLVEFRREQNLTTAAMLGVGFGLGAWIEKAKEANGEFYRTKRGVTSVLDSMLQWPKGISTVDQYARAAKLGAETTEELEEQALKFAMGLEDVGGAYKTLAVSIAPLHLSQKKVLELNESVVASAKRFGMEGSQAAEIVGRAMLTKTIRPVGLLGKYLRNEVGGNLKKLNSTQILERMEQALKKQVPAAELMSQGIGDVLDRIHKRVDKAFRLGTAPIFKEVAGYLTTWDKKLEHMLDSGKISEWGQKLTNVFKEALKISEWLHEHWVLIAGLMGGMKLAGAGAGLGKMAAGLVGTAGFAGKIGGLLGSLGAFGMALGPVIAGLAVLGIALYGLSDWIDGKLDAQDRSRQGAREAIGAIDTMGHIPNGSLDPFQSQMLKGQFQKLHHAGVMSDEGKLDKQAMAYHLGNLPTEEKQALGRRWGLSPNSQGGYEDKVLAEGLAARIIPEAFRHPELLPGAKSKDEPNDKDRKFAGKVQALFTGPITIQQSFEDVDPDRVWIGTKRGIEEQAERRVMSSFSPNFGST